MAKGTIITRQEGGMVDNTVLFGMSRAELRDTFTEDELKLADALTQTVAKEFLQEATQWWTRGKLLADALDAAAKDGTRYNGKITERMAAFLGLSGVDHLKKCISIYRRWTGKRLFEKFASQTNEEGITLQPTHLYHLSTVNNADLRVTLSANVLDNRWSTDQLAKEISKAKIMNPVPEDKDKPRSMKGVFSQLYSNAKKASNAFSSMLNDFDFSRAVENMPPDELISQGYLDKVDNARRELQFVQEMIAETESQLLKSHVFIEGVYKANKVEGNGQDTPKIEGPPAVVETTEVEDDDDDGYEDVVDDGPDESIADIRKRQRKEATAKKPTRTKKAPAKKAAKKAPKKRVLKKPAKK